MNGFVMNTLAYKRMELNNILPLLSSNELERVLANIKNTKLKKEPKHRKSLAGIWTNSVSDTDNLIAELSEIRNEIANNLDTKIL